MRRPARNIAKRLARWLLALAIFTVVLPPPALASSWLERPVAAAVASPTPQVAPTPVPVATRPSAARRDVVPPSRLVTAGPSLPEAVAGKRRLYLLYQELLC